MPQTEYAVSFCRCLLTFFIYGLSDGKNDDYVQLFKIYESTRVRVIIPCLQVVKTEVGVVVITSVHKRILDCRGKYTAIVVGSSEITPCVVDIYGYIAVCFLRELKNPHLTLHYNSRIKCKLVDTHIYGCSLVSAYSDKSLLA